MGKTGQARHEALRAALADIDPSSSLLNGISSHALRAVSTRELDKFAAAARVELGKSVSRPLVGARTNEVVLSVAIAPPDAPDPPDTEAARGIVQHISDAFSRKRRREEEKEEAAALAATTRADALIEKLKERLDEKALRAVKTPLVRLNLLRTTRDEPAVVAMALQVPSAGQKRVFLELEVAAGGVSLDALRCAAGTLWNDGAAKSVTRSGSLVLLFTLVVTDAA